MSSAFEDRLRSSRPTWAEIDLAAFARNIDAIVAGLPEDSRLIAVLKGDGYGHGALELARKCRADRVAMIATALLEESLALQRGGIDLPLLVLGPMRAAQVAIAAERRIAIGVPGPEELASVCDVAREREVAVHLKLDSGMGRMGLTESDLPSAIDRIRAAPNIRIDAVYTHLANASAPDDTYSSEQIARFDRMTASLRAAGIAPPLQHVANSAAAVRRLVRPGDFVRAGIALYGAVTLDTGSDRLEPLMRWRTEVARLKDLPAGSAIGYGLTFRTKRASRIATLPVGYADGYARRLSNRGEVLIRGKRAPVVGRVSMDLVTIDVTDIPDAAVGDEVVLMGRQGDDEIPVEEIAAQIDTISYEVLCSVGARVPRVYRDGDIVAIRSRFDS